jgi:hypothetical protein
MNFAAIIPDRGDRKELTELCFAQLDRMTKKPDKVYHIKHKPESERFDLVQRIHIGTNLAKADGFDWVFIIENDDFYPANYFDKFTPYFENHDFLGDDMTHYYNLRNQSYKLMQHPHRSSLFTTAFRISALNHWDWKKVDPHMAFLDIELWKYGRFKRRKFIQTGAIGIKHGIGLCGGKGHSMNMPQKDFALEWLAENTDEMCFNHYVCMVDQFKRKAA